MTRKHPFLTFFLRRIVGGLATLLVVSVVIFVSTNVLPGDPASAVLGREGTPEAVAALRRALGIDRPLTTRYVEWLGGFVTGDLGRDTIAQAQGANVSVSSRISGPLLNSLVLAAITMVLLVPLSIVLGAIAALKRGRPTDHAITATSILGISMPEFVTGSLLVIVFFGWLNWLPPVSLIPPGVNPFEHVNMLVLPVLTLLIGSAAWSTRLVRAGMLEVLNSDYVEFARLNGFRERKILSRYVLRNSVAPSVQIFAIVLHYLIGGIVITEAVFAYPGIGNELITGVTLRDFTLVQSLAMVLAAFYLVISIVADFLVVLLVPKLRTGA